MKPKKRIFINLHYLEIGGAERALIGMLYAIDTDKYDVDLFLNQHTGPFISLIPKTINLLPEHPAYASIESPIVEALRRKKFGVVLGRVIGKIKYHWFRYRLHTTIQEGTFMQFLYDGVVSFLPSLKKYGTYDLAISYLDPPHIVQDKVDAKVKVEWIHTDFGGETFYYDKNATFERWAANNYIISISDSVTNSFLKKFPELKHKIHKMENIIPVELVEHQANQFFPDEYRENEDKVIICSVGRLSYQKNFECIPLVANILKKNGLNFYWCIIGPGEIEKYNDMANENGVGCCVSYIGSRNNPYPYMKYCNIYVQPSIYEGKAVTVQEAQMLGKPVVITKYPTSASQILNGQDGIICELDNQSIADTITMLANDKNLQINLGKRAAEMHHGNIEEIENLYKLL